MHTLLNYSKENRKEILSYRTKRVGKKRFKPLMYKAFLCLHLPLKAAFWWCYMHSPEPLSAKELLKVMPTDGSIAEVYKRLSPQKKIESSIPTWGDAIVWS